MNNHTARRIIFAFAFSISIMLIQPFLFHSAGAQPADSPWPMYHGSAAHGGMSPYDTSHVDGTVLWEFQAGAAIESSPVIGEGGTIYFGCHDGFLYAVNPDGTVKWKFDAGPPILDERWGGSKSIMATPAVAKDGTVYVYSSANYMFAVNPDGTEKWRFKVKWDNDFWSSPIIDGDGTIYIGSGRVEDLPGYKGGLFAVNPDGTEKWYYDVDNGITMPVSVAPDGTIYFGRGIPSQDKLLPDSGQIVALTNEGQDKWEFDVELWVEGPVTIGPGGTVYATTKEGDMYAITPEGGEKWKFSTTGDGLSAAPAIGADGTIYLGAWDTFLYALTPEGGLKWKYKTLAAFEGITSSPAIGSDGTIYLGSNSGMFYAFSPDGSVKWEFDGSLGSGMTGSPAIASDGTIYAASQNGKLYALGCCGGSSSGKDCITVEYEYDKRMADPVACPRSNFCKRSNFEGTECHEYGSCTDGTYCNMILVNKDSGAGQFILETAVGYHINDLGPGEEVSIGWESIEGCDYLEIIVPKKIVCGGALGSACSQEEFDYDTILHGPVECPASDVCLRWHKNGVDCYEFGDCMEGVWCNLVIVNNDDMGGNFSFSAEAGEFNYHIDGGHGRSMGWAAGEDCNYWGFSAPTRTVCDDGANSLPEGPGSAGSDLQGQDATNPVGPVYDKCGNGICEQGEEEVCHDDCGMYAPSSFPIEILCAVLAVIVALILVAVYRMR